MDDPEELLRRYRPLGPPPELRDRIAAAARTFDVAEGPGPAHSGVMQTVRSKNAFQRWLPAAVAALLTLTFSMLADGARRDVAEQLGKGALTRAAVVSELAASLGGSPAAAEEAERLVQFEELRARAGRFEVGAADREVNNRD